MKTIVTFVVLIVSVSAVAQAPDTLWTRIVGEVGSNEVANAVVSTRDGGFVLAGYSDGIGAGGKDVYLVKIDDEGNLEWMRTYGGTENDVANDIVLTNDGGYLIAGCTWSFGYGDEDMYLVKTNAFGDTLWTRTYGGTHVDQGMSVTQALDGGYLLAGSTGSFGVGHDDIYLVKTDTNGNVLWTRTIGGELIDKASEVIQSWDGGYIVTGMTSVPPLYHSTNMLVVKVDSFGNTEWARHHGFPAIHSSLAIMNTRDGGYIAGGWYRSIGMYGPFYSYPFLQKMDEVGNAQWARWRGLTKNTYVCDIGQVYDGGYVWCGYIADYPNMDQMDAYVERTDPFGRAVWGLIVGTDDLEMANDMVMTSEGEMLLVGKAYYFGGNDDNIYIAKVSLDRPKHMLLSTYELDFGTVVEGSGDVERTITVSNIGETNLEIEIVRSSSPYFYWELEDTLILPDNDVRMQVWFFPEIPDRYSAVLQVKSNYELVEMGLQGECIPVSSLSESFAETPVTYALNAPYPNPFNPITNISYDLPVMGNVKVAVYDLLGRRVTTLLDREVGAGSHHVTWDAADHPSGIYFIQMTAPDYRQVRKVVLLK